MSADWGHSSAPLSELIDRRMKELGKDDRAVAAAVRIGLDNWLKYRRGEIRRVHRKTLERIAEVLGLSTDELTGMQKTRRRPGESERDAAPNKNTSRFLEQRAQALEAEERRIRGEAEALNRRAEQYRSEAAILRQTIEQLRGLEPGGSG